MDHVSTYISARAPADVTRSKHKTHWKAFDRQRPPKFMKLGPTGNDDKRENHIPTPRPS